MPELSIFVDESGEFGTNSEFYLLTLVFHDQSHHIDEALHTLDRRLAELGQPTENAIHTGPIIRKEDEYQNVPLATRRAVFSRLFAFTRASGVSYVTIALSKKEYAGNLKLRARLSRELSLFLREHMGYFTAFDKVIAYYDNGQSAITELLVAVFGAIFFDVDFRKVKPSSYRLFQSADMFCTLELLRLKQEHNSLSKSELIFFESRRKLVKDYLKKLDPMRFRER